MNLLVSILLSLIVYSKTLQCVNDANIIQPIDFWFAIKEPKGTSYVYYDSNTLFTPSQHFLNDSITDIRLLADLALELLVLPALPCIGPCLLDVQVRPEAGRSEGVSYSGLDAHRSDVLVDVDVPSAVGEADFVGHFEQRSVGLYVYLRKKVLVTDA